MSIVPSRRSFIGVSATTFGAAAIFDFSAMPSIATAPDSHDGSENGSSNPRSDFPRQEAETVREVVGASHGRLDRVKELVTARPALAKATWDWGFGDWESAIGAASHVGRRDIAEFLMQHGARPNVFTLAMLGHMEAVRSIVTAMPGVERIPGPHGITLLNHAKSRLRHELTDAERARAEAMVNYLESLPGANVAAASIKMNDEQKRHYVGRFAFGPGTEDYFVVELNRRNLLSIRRGEQVSRVIHLVEPNAFAPAGAPDVRIRFETSESKAVLLTVHDPVPIVTARRRGEG